MSGLFGGGGSSSSSSSSTTHNSMTDNRVALGNGATQLGSFSTLSSNSGHRYDYSTHVSDESSRSWWEQITDNSNRSVDASTSVSDSSSRSWWEQLTDNSNNSRSFTDTSNHSVSNWSQDNSNRSINTTSNSYGTDPGVVHINETNANLLRAVNETNSDSVQAIAGFGVQAIGKMGEAATNIYSQAGQNSAQAWGHTLDVGQEALDKMFDSSTRVLSTAERIATGAMSTYQPADTRQSDNTAKVAIIGAAALVAVVILGKMTKH